MSPVTDIEAAVEELSKEDLSRFREWFLEFDANAWDRQFEQDAGSGKLDSLAEYSYDMTIAAQTTGAAPGQRFQMTGSADDNV